MAEIENPKTRPEATFGSQQMRSERERRLPSYMHDYLDSVRGGVDPTTNRRLSADEISAIVNLFE